MRFKHLFGSKSCNYIFHIFHLFSYIHIICKISISTVSSALLIKIPRDKARKIYMKNMECSMMSRGFKYVVTSVHARIFLYYTLVTNEKKGSDFAQNQFFILRVRSRRDFKIQYEESKMRFMLSTTTHLCVSRRRDMSYQSGFKHGTLQRSSTAKISGIYQSNLKRKDGMSPLNCIRKITPQFPAVVLYCTYMHPYVHRTCMYVCV